MTNDSVPSDERAPTREGRQVLELLADGLERDLGRASELVAVEHALTELEGLAADARSQLERAQRAAVITLVGATGAGKSTLLNALVGDSIAREGEDRPTTSAPVIFRPSDADLSELLDGLPTPADGSPPRVVDYALDTRAWRGQVIVDAPDTNSVEASHREVVRELARRSDVLVVVAHRQSVAELSSASFVDDFAGRRGMLFVLNRVDEVPDASRMALLEQLSTLAAERWKAPDAPVLGVSARRAQADPTDADWRRLVRELEALADDGAVGGVRRRNALGAVDRVAARAREIEARVAPDVERLGVLVEEGLERWRRRVAAAVRERLEVRRADLASMLWNHAAKVWDGPGGYALRAGGLTTLGLGAGAVLARRNPALAAGAAVGAFAVDRTRGALRERSFESTSGLIPGPLELAQWERDELSDARGLATDLFGDPATQVPADTQLADVAARTVEESWAELIDVTLPRTAQDALPGWVHWLVDLPVFALVGWVVWLAASGLFSGEFVGLEVVVTAAIVSLAWLFLCRTAIRRALAARGRRLLLEVEEKTGSSLEAEVRELARARESARSRPMQGLRGVSDADERWRMSLRA